MAYSLDTGDIVEVRVNYLMYGQRMMNVFHYKMDGSGSINDGPTDVSETAQNVAAGIDQWVAKWLAGGSTDCTVTDVEAQKIYPTRYPYQRTLVGENGVIETATLPQNIQLSIEKVGEVADRHGVGRVEVPGIPAAYASAGRVLEVGRDWLAELAFALALDIEAPFETPTRLVPIIFNRAAPATSQLLTTTRLNDTVRVARRRTVGVGE